MRESYRMEGVWLVVGGDDKGFGWLMVIMSRGEVFGVLGVFEIRVIEVLFREGFS